MESTRRRLYFLMSFLLMTNLVYGSREFQDRILASIGYTSRYCFNSASLYLIKFRQISLAQTTDELWTWMERFHSNLQDPQNHRNYYTLLFDFQKMYADCLISRDHGMGKRHAPSKRSLLHELHKTH